MGKIKNAQTKKNDESTPTQKNKRARNEKTCESTPKQQLPGLIKNKRARSKKNDESTPTRELPNTRARRKKNGESTPMLELPNKRARKKKNDESKPIFPPEVITEILSWLPLKYLSQVQLVCKEWQAIIHDHYFTEKHMGHSSVVHHWHNVPVGPTSLNPPKVPFSYIHGCDGLLLFRNLLSLKYLIWNPAIRRVLELPDTHDGSYTLALSFVPATRNYRIVSIYKDKESGGEGCEVLTPGPSMSWRRLTFPDIVNANEHTEKKEKVSVILAGGAVHCVLVTKVGEETVAKIVTLDVETECFTVNRLANGIFCDMKKVWELDWDGKLALADIVGHNLQLMELEDYKKQRWCEEKKIIPLPFMKDSGFEGHVYPLFNRKGDIWFWLKNEKIFAYTIETGKVSDIKPLKVLSVDGRFYPYKPSLVSFEGMQPDTILGIYRPHFRFD